MKITQTTVIAILVSMWFVGKTQTNAGEIPENMALIPAGSFQMGDSFNEYGDDELPVHTVYVSRFYMDKYEVTKALWDKVRNWANSNGYDFNTLGFSKEPNQNQPVTTIDWYEAVRWCNARSEKEGLVPAYYTDTAQTIVYRTGRIKVQNDWVKWDAGYRLPTEAEWEKAARGGLSGKRFPWGDADTITHSRANYFSASYERSYDVSPTRGSHPTFNDGIRPYTNPVGYFIPNGYGLYDMAGNVSEWCWDWYEASYYGSSPANNPHGPTSGLGHVLRGGNWDDFARNCRSASRYTRSESEYWQAIFYLTLGFRTVMPSTAPDAIQVIETEPLQPTYGICPNKLPAKDSLVVVTHGWVPKESGQTAPPNPNWVDTMTNAISTYLQDLRTLKSEVR